MAINAHEFTNTPRMLFSQVEGIKNENDVRVKIEDALRFESKRLYSLSRANFGASSIYGHAPSELAKLYCELCLKNKVDIILEDILFFLVDEEWIQMDSIPNDLTNLNQPQENKQFEDSQIVKRVIEQTIINYALSQKRSDLEVMV